MIFRFMLTICLGLTLSMAAEAGSNNKKRRAGKSGSSAASRSAPSSGGARSMASNSGSNGDPHMALHKPKASCPFDGKQWSGPRDGASHPKVTFKDAHGTTWQERAFNIQ